MADSTVKRAKHATLTAGVVDTVTFNSQVGQIEILNRSSSGYIFFTVDGTTPTVAGDNTYVVAPGASLQVNLDNALRSASRQADAVRLISSVSADYSATGTA